MFNWIRKLFRRRRFGLSLAPSDEQIVTLRFRKERLDAVSAGPFAPPASQTPEWQLDPRMTEVTEILLDMVDRWKTPPRLFPDAAQEAPKCRYFCRF